MNGKLPPVREVNLTTPGSLCTRCSDCADACPPGVILRVAEGPDAGAPYLNPREGACARGRHPFGYAPAR